MMLCRADIQGGRVTGEVVKMNTGSGKRKGPTSIMMRILPGEGVVSPGKVIKRHVRRHNVVFQEQEDNG